MKSLQFATMSRRHLLRSSAALAGAPLSLSMAVEIAAQSSHGDTVTFETLGNANEAGITTPISLTYWNGRIYIGEEWLANRYPVPAIYLDPVTGELVHDGFWFPEQAIEKYRVVGSALYALGTRPLEYWGYGSLYRKLPDAPWEALPTVPGAAYQFSLGIHGEVLTISGADEQHNGAVWQSWDYGYSWAVVQTFPNTDYRGYPLGVNSQILTMGKSLVVVTARNGMFAFDGIQWTHSDLGDLPAAGTKSGLPYGDVFVLVPYHSWGTLNTRMDQVFVLEDGTVWTVEIGEPVMDAVVAGDRLVVLLDLDRRAGSVLISDDITCRCVDAFTEIGSITAARPRSMLLTDNRLLVGCDDGSLLLSTPLPR